MENSQQLRAQVAQMESKNDLLEAELIYLNSLLIEVGFPGGIQTLKATAEELLEEIFERVPRQGFES